MVQTFLRNLRVLFQLPNLTEELLKVWAEYVKWQTDEDERLGRLYPPNPPNEEKCHWAVISGLVLSNLAGFKVGDLNPYFSFGQERAYVWTHSKNTLSSLVVEVPPQPPPSGQLWKTLASCLEIAGCLESAAEHPYEHSYGWIYQFNPRLSLEQQRFYGFSEGDPLAWIDVKGGIVQNLWFIADLAAVLELLQRDDRFFIAAQHLLASVRSHWFCITCELGSGRPEHPSHEPSPWEAIQLLPRLDIAMVQACRSAGSASWAARTKQGTSHPTMGKGLLPRPECLLFQSEHQLRRLLL